MKKDTEIALQIALARIKQLENENEKLKQNNLKISNDLINSNALYNSKSIQVDDLLSKVKESDKKISKLESDNKNLKTDNESLKTDNNKLEKDNKKLELELEEKKETIKNVKKELIKLKVLEAKAINALFGQASAKAKNLFSAAANSDDPSTSAPSKDHQTPEKRGRKKGTENFHNWNKNNYESVETKIERLNDEMKCEDCNGDLKFLNFEKFEKITPVTNHMRKEVYYVAVYECLSCGKKYRAKVKNLDCFSTSACTPELAGYLAMLSCGLYLPSNRISLLFSYNETPISRELVTRYLIKTGELLSDFVNFYKKKIEQQNVLMLDETVWYALNDENKTNRIWCMTSGPREQNRGVYFMYSSGREKEEFNKILDENYAGVIVSDSYPVYFRQKLHQLCWSHLRKYLFDYLKALGIKAANTKEYKEVEELFNKCNLIFDKERELAKDNLSDEELLKRRRSELKPLIDDYFATAEKYYVDDDDPKNKAINYGLGKKEYYYTLLDYPGVPLTNNISETSARKAVLKRTSSMFSTSVKGAESMCVLLSLVQSAKMNDLSPDKYISYLLKNIEDLKDERVAVSYLPWSKPLKEKLGFTEEEIKKATKEVEEELSKNKN